MKIGKHRPDEDSPQKPSSSEKASAPAKLDRAPKLRRWFFRVMAMVVAPLVLLGALELALRLAGYGYPTSFFLRTRIGEREFCVPNPKFTYRFFPRALARPTLPIRFAADKPTNTFRIFLFGESAANGDPDPTYGMARYLQALLRERYPKTDFEVLCVAITGINSHTILPIARECAGLHGDLWIIYMGNNEMVGPFGAETVFGARAPSLVLARATLAVKTTKIGQLLDACAERLKRPGSSLKTWGGMEMFIQNQVRPDDPARLRVYENLKGNLDDILRAGERSGVPIILTTVAVNLKDCTPFASMHSFETNGTAGTAWTKAYEQGVARETAGSFGEALSFYREAAGTDGHYADLQYRMARCELLLTNSEQARHSFELARDYDALAFRADTAINEAIKKVGALHRGVHLVDAAEVLSEKSTDRIAGSEFFYEHVHLNFEGNYLLALTFANQVRSLLPGSITANDKGTWAAEEQCERRLAVTVWDRQRIWQPIFDRILRPPFTGQLEHDEFFKRCEAKLNQARERMNSQTPEQARQMYLEALALAPEDNLLHGNFERFLEAAGDLNGAIVEAQRVSQLVPYLPGPSYYTGTLLVRAGKTREAEEYFERALAIQGDYAQAYNELGLIALGRRESEKARSRFRRALKADPNFADALVNLGLMEQQGGRLDQALNYYEKAARLQPLGPPDYLNRGVGLAASRRSAQAIECFRALIQQAPNYWQAHYLLAVELAGAGRTEEARSQFSEVLRCRPDYAQILPDPSTSSQ